MLRLRPNSVLPFVLLIGLQISTAAAQTLVPGVSSVAVNDDATALLTNPAAICRSIRGAGYFSWDHTEDNRLRIGTGILADRGFGLGYQYENPKGPDWTQRAILGFGGGRSDFSLGLRAAYQWGEAANRKDSAWRWDAGMIFRPHARLSLGAMAYDLAEAELFGATLDRGYRVGLAARPLPGAWRDRLTLHGDFSGPEDGTWESEGRLQAGLWAEVFPGISAGFAVDGPFEEFNDGRTFSFGVALNSLNATTLAGAFLDSEDELDRSVQAVQMTASRQRTPARERQYTKSSISGSYGDEGQSGLPLPLIGAPDLKSARPVLEELKNAAEDPHVRGVLIDLEPLAAGALTDEIRASIHRIRSAGKPVVAFSQEIGNRAQYAVASACDRIVIDPLGGVGGLALRSDILYMGEMLDSVGIRFEKVQRGKYKTAGEPLVHRRPTEGMLESLNSVIDDWHDNFLTSVSADRKLERSKLEDLADGRWIHADDALSSGLVDSLGDERCARRILARMAGGKGEAKTISARGWTYRDDAWKDTDKVAVLWLDGSIVEGRSTRSFMGGNTMGSTTVVKQLRDLAGRRDVKAVVLRVDSPGGSALASDEIWRATEELKKKGKKVVVSMARVAGSGGYYIACNADRIIAEPGTITGSIGVLFLKTDMTGFYERKKIHVETFERGRMSGLMSSAHRLTEEERTHVQGAIDHYYSRFLDRVEAGRKMDRARIDALGQGRIWTGRQAKENGLIDDVGGLHEAVAAAKALASLPDEAKVEHIYRPAASWFERLLFDTSTKVAAQAAQAAFLAAGPAASDPWSIWMLQRQLREPGLPGGTLKIALEDPLLEELARMP